MKCPYCTKYQSENLNSLRIHVQKSHKISSKQLHLDLFCDGEAPTCKCGCGETPNFKSLQKGFCDFLQGHHVRETNGFWTEEGLEKSAETRREQYQNGEREPWNKGETGLQEAWNKGLTKETDERVKSISESLMGHEVSEETRRKIRKSRIEYMRKSQKSEPSGLETTFAKKFLDMLDIKYQMQKVQKDYVFDFYLTEEDIFIEVHGDFWHCNPEYYDEPEYECQKRSIENDMKKKRALENKTLLVFWENDIKNNPKKVMNNLLKHI